jgi:hypothetical protein
MKNSYNHQTKTRRERSFSTAKWTPTQKKRTTKRQTRQIPNRQTKMKTSRHPCPKLKQDAMMDEKMKFMLAIIKDNIQNQLNEQAKKRAEQLAEMKQSTTEAHNLLTHKSIATPQTHNHK